MLTQILTLLCIVAVPATLIAIVDDWFLRPRRLAAGQAKDPPLVAFIYLVLPVLLLAALLRLLVSERLDFSLVLVLVVAIAGLVWLADELLFAPARRRAASSAGRDGDALPLPVTVDYARSFFPVAVIVLLVRAFIFEPFRIPSDSMMPTLLDGDFIIVNKFAYGLRLPVLNRKFLDLGEPQRGDVVVFRFPLDPAVNYIKRLVGRPGDRVRVESDELYVNGVRVPLQFEQRFDDGCYHNMRLSSEVLGTHHHEVLSCLTPDENLQAPPSPTCSRAPPHNYECVEPGLLEGQHDYRDMEEITVPPGYYLMIGDNRDNSADSRFWGAPQYSYPNSSDRRYWGFVPESYLVGKATRIWFNWDWGRSGGPKWSRIWHRIE